MGRRPVYFVVSGAHGAGKTTVLEAIGPMLRESGLTVRQFHHVTDVMPGKSTTPAAPRQDDDRPRAWWRRCIPRFIKLIVASILDERCYMRGVNAILEEAKEAGQIALSDRYAYDRLVDLRLRQRPLIQRAAVWIVCTLMRRPTLTVILQDEPEAIYRRKQELTVPQIAWYQRELEIVCSRFKAPKALLSIAGRDANAVARELAEMLIGKAQEELSRNG